jgi:SAM-dependent MidA family methyltransferase
MGKLLEIIVSEIRNRGPMTFARFMELALYCPVYGYYEKEGDKIGRRGDYYTSAAVGPVFGELLAWQLAEWLEQDGRGALSGTSRPRYEIVETGCHRAELAADILKWIGRWQSHLLPVLTYWLVEPSEHRTQWQKATLGDVGSQVRWARSFEEISASGGVAPSSPAQPPAHRIIFSNELLDAMPVHRLGWDARNAAWFEWGVTVRDGILQWHRLPQGEISGKAFQLLQRILTNLEAHSGIGPANAAPGAGLLEVLPDDFILEVCPAADDWWRQAATALGSGKLLAFDYGVGAEDMLLPERPHGTLRAYRQHQVSNDLLACPGEQDLTAHVNFSLLEETGRSAGLRNEMFSSQGSFLVGIAERASKSNSGFEKWTPARTRQFHALTHPEHLGRALKVLVQSTP